MQPVPSLGLKGKTIFSLGLLITVSMIVMGILVYWQSRELANQQAYELTSVATERRANRLDEEIGKSSNMLVVMHDTPPVQGIIRAREAGGIDPLDHDTLGKWEDRMASIFKAFLVNNPDFNQIRYLDERGMEIVRLHKVDSNIVRERATALQNKADTDYFKGTIKLHQGEVYRSQVNFNREHGRIEVPYVPVFRLSTPVFNRAGKLRGVLVVNLLATPFLKYTIPTEKGRSAYVIRQDGYFLLHPDKSKTFGFELDFDYRLKDEFPTVVQAVSMQDSGVVVDEASGGLLSFIKVYLNPQDRQNYWVLIHRMSRQEAMGTVDSLRQNLLESGIVIILLSLLAILWLANRFVVTPVVVLAEAARKMREGDLSVRLPVEQVRDEFRAVYQTLNEFAEAQQQATANLEQQVSERTEHLSCIVDNLVDGLVLINEQGIVQSFNPAAEHIFGYRADEVIGHNINMLMPEPYHSQHDGYLQHYRDTGEHKVIGQRQEVVARRKDGSVFPIDLAVNEMRVGNKRQFIGTVRDITERKAGESMLAEKNRELKIRSRYDHSYALAMELFSTNNDQQQVLSGLLDILAQHHPFPVLALYTFDEWHGAYELVAAHGATASITQSFERGEGLIGQAALDNTSRLLDGLDEEHGLSIEAGVLSFRPASVLISPISFHKKVDGVLVLVSSKALLDLDREFIDRLTRQIGVAMNNLKQHADLLALSGQLRKRGEQIETQNARLEQADRMKSEFMANMSHELRTPLNAIIGFSEVIKDGVMGELNTEQTEYIGEIFTSGQHLLSLINDILDLSKIEAGKMDLETEPVALAELLSNSLSIVKERAMSHHITLESALADDIGICLLDVRKLKQIAYNLLSNAVKFTPDGGTVRLSAQRVNGSALAALHPAPLALPAALEGEFIEISVTDTGIGIRVEDLQKLFSPFTQLDSSLARKYEGTGLGLVMVKHIAELHGGSVGVASELGKGSTFAVWLAYRSAEHAASVIPVGKPGVIVPKTAASASVLIVEDDDQAAELIRRQLEDEGYSTRRVSSAEEALTALEQELPDLITLDIKLPGMDGWEFLTHIKQQDAWAGLPVVIVSIVAEEKRGFALGASQVLQKPVSKTDLLAALEKVAGQRGWTEQESCILVVDDDPKAVEFVSRHLEAAGCSVTRAYGGAEAIEAANRRIPDLIVLDLMMPEVTGFDVVHALKAKPETAAIPIIILTAKTITAEDRQRLHGDVVKIVEKNHFNGGGVIAEVRRIRKDGSHKVGTDKRPVAAPALLSSPEKQDAPLILIAEDNDAEAGLIERYLSNQGYRTARASNGRDAREQMLRLKPDLITLDLMMPEMDGFEFLNEKAKSKEHAAIPVLIVSGMDNPEKGLSLGAHAILRKPVQRDHLLEVIASIGVRPARNKKPKILIVDDDPKSVRIIATYFDSKYYDTIQTFGGEEGLAAARHYQPDLMLLDLMMPGMDGFQVVDQLKQDNNTRSIPVIVLTAKLLSKAEREELMQHVRMIEQKGGVNKETFLFEVSQLLRK